MGTSSSTRRKELEVLSNAELAIARLRAKVDSLEATVSAQAKIIDRANVDARTLLSKVSSTLGAVAMHVNH